MGLVVHARTHMHTASHTVVYTHLYTHKLKHTCIKNTQQPVKCYYELIHTYIRATVANSGETGEFMCAAETLTALSLCGRYTKCSLPLVPSPRPKTNLLLSPFIHNSCSLVHLF